MGNLKISSYILLIAYFTTITSCSGINFNGIPAAFGDLDLNRRTDIVVISGDGKNLTILLQHEPQQESQHLQSSSCRLADKVAQVYITDINSDGKPNLLVLLEKSENGKLFFDLVNLELPNFTIGDKKFSRAKLTPATAYSLPTSAALISDTLSFNNSQNNNSIGQPSALVFRHIIEQDHCKFDDLKIRMLSQPFLFDLDGDLRTDFMGIDVDGKVSVWKSRDIKNLNMRDLFTKITEDWFAKIPTEYFDGPHSNGYVDMNGDGVADIVLSSRKSSSVSYMYANSDKNVRFDSVKTIGLQSGFNYGQSSLVDINADGKIEHLIPRCNETACEIVILYDNGSQFPIFNFKNTTVKYDYQLAPQNIGSYEFPVMLRASDLDGDGYTDFVTVAKDKNNSKNKFDVIYLHNIPAPDSPFNNQTTMHRTFEVIVIASSNDNKKLVTLFDVNEDGKVDMLIGKTDDSNSEPKDLNVTAKLNDQMVDACFMKVLVTNGLSNGDGSYGQSARGPTVCFELSQNDGKKMQGCAGQQAQASYFALQQPYVIFGLGQTPHFVEKLMVTIPGFGSDGKNRTRQLEQIVPDAQIIIIPRDPSNSSSWDYKMFLSPMTELVPPTLIALAVICVFLLIIIYFLHRQETIEDAAEHEEYKRHWPESRG